MHTVILLAGFGSRLNRQDLPHKAFLKFGKQTLLARHLQCLDGLDMEKIVLVLGHNKQVIKDYVKGLDIKTPVEFVDNDLYATTGNTLSVVMGLERVRGEVLIMDGDVLYPMSALEQFVRNSSSSSFAVVESDIDNAESAKVLMRPSGTIEAFVTKRQLTGEEKEKFEFAGEAIGFIRLSEKNVAQFIRLYYRKEKEYLPTLWEIPFTDFARETDLGAWKVEEEGCFEIDTQEDYEQALSYFEAQNSDY